MHLKVVTVFVLKLKLLSFKMTSETFCVLGPGMPKHCNALSKYFS